MRGRKLDAGGVIDMFGQNGLVKKGVSDQFVAEAGLLPARVVDPVTAQQVVGTIPG